MLIIRKIYILLYAFLFSLSCYSHNVEFIHKNQSALGAGGGGEIYSLSAGGVKSISLNVRLYHVSSEDVLADNRCATSAHKPKWYFKTSLITFMPRQHYYFDSVDFNKFRVVPFYGEHFMQDVNCITVSTDGSSSPSRGASVYYSKDQKGFLTKMTTPIPLLI